MSRLLVPITVDALAVRDAGGPRLADLRMRDPEGDGPAGQLMPPSFTDREPRPKGIHLHWAMPDALTRGREGDDGPVLAAVPDRWLVVRLSPSARQRLVRGWVLLAGGSKAKVVPVEQFREPGPATDARAPLTHFGHGHPAWAAIADCVEGRSAFHDPLDDVEPGAVAYLVCGWHADPALDPLGGSFASGRERRAEPLGWRTPTGGVPRVDVGGATLYHGSVVGIGWPDAELGVLGADVGGPPSADRVRVVIGSALSEVLAATRSTAEPLHDRVITAVAAGLHDRLALPDGRRRIDDGLHERMFVSFPGGTVTETVWEPPSAPQGVPPGRPPIVGPIVDAVLTADEAPPIRVVSHGVPFDRGIRDVLDLPFDAVLDAVAPTPPAPPPSPGTPGRFVEVVRPLPPFHGPADPVVLVEGAGRSFKHGGDGRFSADGTLACRWSGSCVSALTVGRTVVTGASLLDRSLGNAALPPECDELLRELAVIDPGSAPTAKTLAGVDPEVVRVEQTAWWALRERRLDALPLLVHSGLTGTLPSPVGCAPPVAPWNPLFLEWAGELLPSVRPWALGEVDLEPPDLETGAAVPVSGRVLLGPGAARLAGATARTARRDVLRIGTGTVLPLLHRPAYASDVAGRLAGVLDGLDFAGAAGELAPVEDRLDDGDWIAGSLDALNTSLRGGIPGDGNSVGAEGSTSPFLAARAGFLRITRLRLVDGYGQFVDLDPARVEWAPSLSVDGAPELGLLATRFTAPTRVRLAWRDATGAARDADDRVSPLCGWLLPDLLDGALEVLEPDGRSVGQVRRTDAALAWEPAPGTPGTVGLRPERTLGSPFVAGLVRGLLDHGVTDGADPEREDVLSAFLRVVDATRWSTDPFAHTGEEHLALLVGHPIALMRAELSLEVREPVGPPLADAVEVRVGSLAHWQDGVLGYYLDDDYRVLHLPDGASARFARPIGPGQGFLQRIDRAMDHFANFAADLGDPAGAGGAPVTHPLVDASGVVSLRPGQVRRLLLLVEPHAVVHVRAGIVPATAAPMRRPWVAAGLANLAPTFRFGPLLLDPHVVRLPVPTRGGGWSFESRSAPDAWMSEPVATGAGEVALSATPVRVVEGWLRFAPGPTEGDSP